MLIYFIIELLKMVTVSSGVTQVLDPYGRRIQHLPIIEEGILAAMIGREKNITRSTGGLFLGCVWL